MNFLAHAYLSFGDADIIVGNLIADTVRGKQILEFPKSIQEGIRIHRLIDEYTDKHPINLEAKLIFRDVAGRYDSSLLDVAYDHFLAIDPKNTPPEGWQAYAQKCYASIEKHGSILPPMFCSMYMYMKSEDWLSTYHQKEMIAQSFERLKRRAAYLNQDTPIYDEFLNKYEYIKEAYHAFFPNLKAYALTI